MNMPADFDASEFVDGDFQFHKTSYAGLASVTTPAARAPLREEENARALAIQQELAELKKRQEEKERERAAVEKRLRRRTCQRDHAGSTRAFARGGKRQSLGHPTGIGRVEKAPGRKRARASRRRRALASPD